MDRWDRNLPRGRPAHAEGTTRCAYTPDGRRLVTVGVNNTIRIYKTTGDDEPTNIDDCPENNTCVAASSDFFVVGAEDGTVSLYSIAEAKFERFLTRCPLPVRDVSISPDGIWCAIASDETTAKLVGTQDTMQFHSLSKHGVSAKHVAFHPNGKSLGLACADGSLVFYSVPGAEPEIYRKVDGIGADLDPESAASGAIVWFPDGQGFGVPTPLKEIQVVSFDGWNKERKFPDGHLDRISAFAWSPNGALLASAGLDANFLIWDTQTQNVIDRRRIPDVIDMAWHPKSSSIAFTTSQGELHVHELDQQQKFSPFLDMGLQTLPFFRDRSGGMGEMARNGRSNGVPHKDLATRPRRHSVGSLEDSLLDDDMNDYGDLDDFVVDDDGAGYAPGRKRGPEDELDGPASKRRNLNLPQIHEAFQPGSTPWRGNRKYLCLNLVGVVWTVDQDGHNTVTVEFYDREFQRDFHFTDTYLYDKACLNEKGALFSSAPKGETPATIFYRPHETWTQRSDWKTDLPIGEIVHAMSLSESFVTVVTSANYVRVYTLFGIPYRVYRPKSSPVVTCASWRNYVMTVGNGPVGTDGRTRLVYSIYNTKRDEVCQNEDTVALPHGESLASVFFSDKGVSITVSLLAVGPQLG
jgi:chromosome transmission fidelity protein 4